MKEEKQGTPSDLTRCDGISPGAIIPANKNAQKPDLCPSGMGVNDMIDKFQSSYSNVGCATPYNNNYNQCVPGTCTSDCYAKGVCK